MSQIISLCLRELKAGQNSIQAKKDWKRYKNNSVFIAAITFSMLKHTCFNDNWLVQQLLIKA